MADNGLKSGRQIARLAKALHPKALLIVPLYRSCFVIQRQSQADQRRGAATCILYHDPQWMGDSRSKARLKKYKEVLTFFGQRSGPELYLRRTKTSRVKHDAWKKDELLLSRQISREVLEVLTGEGDDGCERCMKARAVLARDKLLAGNKHDIFPGVT